MKRFLTDKTIPFHMSRLSISIISVLLLSDVFGINILSVKSTDSQVDFYVGVDVAYANLTAIKSVIDRVSSYTNVFVIGSTGISYEQAKLDETCQYLYDRGLSFIIYTEKQFQIEWFEYAKNNWNDHFLGFYFLDEIGGRQLDRVHMPVRKAENYADAGNQFVNVMNGYLRLMNHDSDNSTVFTSDYALYWFDYGVGYDVVLAQFGWNYSRQLNVALNRGAATVEDRDWGVIITWTYSNPPYIESGEELYRDLVLAYDNGAKYILVFDSNEDYTGGILEEEHFEALEQFWEYAADNPRTGKVEEHVAFVLPEGYGYGFRGPEDKIWGLWESDWLSFEISYHIGSLLDEYGTRLDIVYDNFGFNLREKYSDIVLWNGKNYSEPKIEVPPEDVLSVFVSDVIDGNSFETSEGYKIRLVDIKAPELGGVGYNESRAFLELLIENKKVTLDIDSEMTIDSHGRYVSLVYVPYNSTHSLNVNQVLVEGGYAAVYDYTNNEFDPTVWTLYTPRNSIPEFQFLQFFLLFLLATLSAITIKIKMGKNNGKDVSCGEKELQ